MEENKINMPQPPKELRKMPPPPPPRQNVNDISNPNEQNGESLSVSSNSQEKPVSNNNENRVESVVSNAQNVAVKDGTKTEEKNVTKEVKNVEKKQSGGIKTVLYWLGFVVALAGMAFLIYMLVK